jgi:phosphoserine phosphatase
VLATARKDFDPNSFDPHADLLPLVDGLTLLALVGIVDPPRPQAKAAIATAKSAGIKVRMITGDHAVTAAAIAKTLGIEGRAITGAEFAAMSDDEALETIEGIGVIARVTPEDKVRLVDILKRRGHVVAMTGDGVNDAPALKRADIGIAMGITGTEVSKEAAAMILTDDDFSTIVKAVEIGRGLYDNLQKYIKFQMAALIGFIVTFLGASLFNIVGGVPFVPLQTLWINFTTQVLQAIGLAGADETQAAAGEGADPEPEPAGLADGCRARARRNDARGHLVGRRRPRHSRRAHDGHDDLRDRERVPVVHGEGPAQVDLQPRVLRGPAAAQGDGLVRRGDPLRHRARDLPTHPRHRQPHRARMDRVHPRGVLDRRRLRDPEGTGPTS